MNWVIKPTIEKPGVSVEQFDFKQRRYRERYERRQERDRYELQIIWRKFIGLL